MTQHGIHGNLKRLIECANCARQYDTAGLQEGARFHCSCGDVLTAKSVSWKDSAVVRCSACGAARHEDAASCGYCQADFTVHERDLAVICPRCATRLPRSAKYCHACGGSIDMLASRPGGPTDRKCPSCETHTELHSRRLGDLGAAKIGDVPPDHAVSRRLGSVLECPRCAGLWISAQAFGQLERQAKQGATMDASLQPRSASAPKSAALPLKGQGPLYRRCVVCDEFMTRRNYARRSGVVLDVCRDHGVWFDEKELESILEWIRTGGWEREEMRRQQESRDAAQRLKRQQSARSADWGSGSYSAAGSTAVDGVWFIDLVVDVLSGLFSVGSG